MLYYILLLLLTRCTDPSIDHPVSAAMATSLKMYPGSSMSSVEGIKQNCFLAYVSLSWEHGYDFRWETGYWGTMDIAHDRAGYYLCWGCLNWVPAIYTSPALYITEHPVEWSLPAAIAIGVAGAAAIYINYDSDRQRQVKFPAVCVT